MDKAQGLTSLSALTPFLGVILFGCSGPQTIQPRSSEPFELDQPMNLDRTFASCDLTSIAEAAYRHVEDRYRQERPSAFVLTATVTFEAGTFQMTAVVTSDACGLVELRPTISPGSNSYSPGQLEPGVRRFFSQPPSSLTIERTWAGALTPLNDLTVAVPAAASVSEGAVDWSPRLVSEIGAALIIEQENATVLVQLVTAMENRSVQFGAAIETPVSTSLTSSPESTETP